MRVRFFDNARAHRAGAAAAEMAIVVPFLAFMFAVSVDYCRIYFAAQVVNNAARAGALYASGTATAANGLSPQQAAQQAALAEAVSLSPPLQAANITVTTGAAGATVTVTYKFQTICRYPALPAQVPVTGTVTMPLATAVAR